jgi:mannosyltransferase OCH1-like enzyme
MYPRRLLPEWRYHAWTEEDNVALVKHLFPNWVNEYINIPSGGNKTDTARYLYMHKYGGFYFDADFRFLAITEDLMSHRCILGIEDENMPELGGGPKLGNAFIGSEPGFTLWTELVDSIFARSKQARSPVLGNCGARTR